MNQELLSLIVRESISAFFLLLVLVGVFRLLSRLIDVLDDHLGEIETQVGQIVNSLDECLREVLSR